MLARYVVLVGKSEFVMDEQGVVGEYVKHWKKVSAEKNLLINVVAFDDVDEFWKFYKKQAEEVLLIIEKLSHEQMEKMSKLGVKIRALNNQVAMIILDDSVPSDYLSADADRKIMWEIIEQMMLNL